SFTYLFHPEFLGLILIYVPICVSVLYSLRIYTGLVRYTNTADIARILTTTSLVNLAFGAVLFVGGSSLSSLSLERIWGLLVFNWCLSTLVLISLRLATKRVYHFFTANHHPKNKVKAVIYGTDQRAIMIRQA